MDDSRMQQGESLFREGRVDEAEACFQAVLGDNPANAQALSNLGVLAVSRKDVGRAEHFFLEALKADGEHLASLSNLADLYIERQVWANALSCLTQSCELAPGNVDLHNKLATVYLEVGDQLRASQAITASLGLNPNQPGLRETLGLLENFLSSYSVVQTTVASFLVSNRDQVIRRFMSQGVPFGKEEIDRAVSVLTELSGGAWRGRTFVDVGANIGSHSVYACKAHDFEKGLAIEVAADNFRVLRCNLILAGLDDRITPVHCGLSSSSGASTVELNPSNLGDHRLRLGHARGADVHGEAGWQTEPCELRTFDEVVPRELLGSQSGLVWIDTQGHEVHVLRGANSLFETGTPFVMELWPYGLERQGASCDDITELLSSCAVYDLRDNSTRLDPDGLAALYSRYRGEEAKGQSPHTDLLVLPQTRS